MAVLKSGNINEISYYVMFGAKMIEVTRHRLSKRSAGKKGFDDQWVITVSDVIPWMKEAWKQGMAYGNITEYVNVRTKLKGKIKRELGISPS